MSKILTLDQSIIVTEPLINIIYKIKQTLNNTKLKDIRVTNSDIRLTCPNDAHAGGKEHNPDCHINLDDNNPNVPYGFFHCFGCDAAGTFIHFVALCFSTTDDYAKEWLQANYGILVKEKILIDDSIQVNKPTLTKFYNEEILDTFQTWTPYLAKRHLAQDACEKFKVRYDPKTRQVIFPVYNMQNRLVMLARRNIDTKVFYMDKDREKEVYGLNVIQKNNIKSCIITEGPIDCLTGWSHGIPTIATLGTISSYQIEQINKSCLTSLYLAFDNDDAGRKFNSIIKTKIAPRILITDLDFPKERKDINELTNDEWQKIIQKYNFNAQNIQNLTV